MFFDTVKNIFLIIHVLYFSVQYTAFKFLKTRKMRSWHKYTLRSLVIKDVGNTLVLNNLLYFYCTS